MTESKIEWTDRSNVGSDDDTSEYSTRHLGWPSASGLDPFPDVAVSLGAIAGAAGRHNVVSKGPSAFHDGHDVIPCRRCIRAIGAVALELFEKRFQNIDRDRINSALFGFGVLAACGSMPRVGLISIAGKLSRVNFAQPRCADIRGWEPCCTSPAKAETILSQSRSFGPNVPASGRGVSTYLAAISKTVKSRSILRKIRYWLELLTEHAALLSILATRDIAGILRAAVTHRASNQFGGRYHVA